MFDYRSVDHIYLCLISHTIMISDNIRLVAPDQPSPTRLVAPDQLGRQPRSNKRPPVPQIFHGTMFFFSEDMGVSKNRGTPKSWILIGISNINHPFWGTTISGNTHMVR